MSKPKHITQKLFQDPLLHVLAELSDFTAEKAIQHTETYFPVCQKMEITEKEWGASNQGTLWTHRLIGLAMKNLRDAGKTQYLKRGVWALTSDGLEEVTNKEKTDGDTFPEVDSEGSSLTSPPSLPSVSTLHKMSQQDHHPYSDDPYLRLLAIESLNCLGAFSIKSPLCKECPFQAECVGAMHQIKSQIAADLEAEEKAIKAREEARTAEKSRRDKSVDELISLLGSDSDETPSNRNLTSSGKFQLPSDKKAVHTKCQADSVCEYCQEKIEATTVCWWARGLGVFHLDCLEVPQNQQ